MTIAGRCSICNFELESFEGLTSCPNCGTKRFPLGVEHDLSIDINWGTLRMLVMWAERWAGQYKDQDPDMLRAVYNAADKLQQQWPDKMPLTLFSDIQQLREHFGKVETNLPKPPEPRLTISDAVQEVDKLLRDGKDSENE